MQIIKNVSLLLLIIFLAADANGESAAVGNREAVTTNSKSASGYVYSVNRTGRMIRLVLTNNSNEIIRNLSVGKRALNVNFLLDETEIKMTGTLGPGQVFNINLDLPALPVEDSNYVIRWRWVRGCSNAVGIANTGAEFLTDSGNKCTNPF